jgi:peptide/nickel transport system substrate-binding protein
MNDSTPARAFQLRMKKRGPAGLKCGKHSSQFDKRKDKTMTRPAHVRYFVAVLFIPLLFFSPSLRSDCQAEKVVTIAEGYAPYSLDPHVDTNQAARNISDSLCEPLFWYDFSKKQLVPNLATSIKNLNDNTWKITLRKGVSFTNGEALDANTVKFSIERIKDPQLKSRLLATVRNIKQISIIDPYTVELVTSSPTPTLPFYLTRVGMIPPQYAKEKGAAEFGKKPIGTGPFEIVRWVQDEYVEIRANRNYWRGKAKVDRVIFRSVPETITRMAALKTGEAHLASNLMIEEIPSIKANKELEVESIPSIRMLYIQFNMLQDSPLRDKRVRQAMNYAVDVDSIVKNVLQGYGVRLSGQLISKEYEGFNPNVKPYPFDPAKARTLMKEAGAENYQFTLNASTGRYLRDKEIAEVVANQLNAAGIKTKLNIMEHAALTQQLMNKKFVDLLLNGLATPPPTADLFYGVGVREGPFYSTYVNREFNQAFDEAVSTIEKEKRQRSLYRLGEICRDDPPAIFLHQQVTIYGHSKRLTGFVPSPDEKIDPYLLDLK